MTPSVPPRASRWSAAVGGGSASGAIYVGQVVITIVLIVIAAVRSAGDGVPVAWVLALSLVFAGWYIGGLIVGQRARDPVLATWWLVGLAEPSPV